MPHRKKEPPEGTNPAFVVADAKHTDYLGLTKADWFSGFVVMGIFAGPAGQAILDSQDDQVLANTAGVARHMGDVMAATGRS